MTPRRGKSQAATPAARPDASLRSPARPQIEQGDLFQTLPWAPGRVWTRAEVLPVARVWARAALNPGATLATVTAFPRAMPSLVASTAFSEALRELVAEAGGSQALPWPMPNLWIGLRVTCQADLAGLGPLESTYAGVRFLSCDLTEPVTLPFRYALRENPFDGNRSIGWVDLQGDNPHHRQLAGECHGLALPCWAPWPDGPRELPKLPRFDLTPGGAP